MTTNNGSKISGLTARTSLTGQEIIPVAVTVSATTVNRGVQLSVLNSWLNTASDYLTSASIATLVTGYNYLTSASAVTQYQPVGDYPTSASVDTMITGYGYVTTFASATDVSVSSPTDNQGMFYSSAQGQWINRQGLLSDISDSGSLAGHDTLASASDYGLLLTSASAATQYQAAGDYVTSASLDTVLANYVVSSGNTITIGASSSASVGLTDYIAIGHDAVAFGNYGVAIGDTANAQSLGVALGYFAYATSEAVAVGDVANAIGTNAIALGLGSRAATTDSVAIGTSASASSGTGGVVIGANGAVFGTNAVAVGTSAKASGANSLALGYDSHTFSDNSMALGVSASANGAGSMAIGPRAGTFAVSAVAIGPDANTATQSQIKLGADNNSHVKLGGGFNWSDPVEYNNGTAFVGKSTGIARVSGNAAGVTDLVLLTAASNLGKTVTIFYDVSAGTTVQFRVASSTIETIYSDVSSGTRFVFTADKDFAVVQAVTSTSWLILSHRGGSFV